MRSDERKGSWKDSGKKSRDSNVSAFCFLALSIVLVLLRSFECFPFCEVSKLNFSDKKSRTAKIMLYQCCYTKFDMNEIPSTSERRQFIKNSLGLTAGAAAMAVSVPAVAAKPQMSSSTTIFKFSPNDKFSLATEALQKEIDRLSAMGGGTLVIPAGTYTTGTVFLKSNVHIELEQGAVWLGSANIEDYADMGWGHNKDRQPWHLIYADGVENVAITGLGKIDGGSDDFWQPYEKDAKGNMVEPRWIKAKDKKVSPLIDINNSDNIVIRDVTLVTGGGWNLHLFDCDNVKIHGVRVMNNIYSPNSDGIDLSGCRDVSISDCHIKTCDDAIVLKTLPDSRTCERVAVTNCVIETLCVGIKMGAHESFHDMRHFSASNCVFVGTSRFFALYSKNGGHLENITISNITGDTNAKLVFNRPIQLMVERNREGKIGSISNVYVSNVACHTDGRILITSDEPGAIDNVTIRDTSLTYPWVEDPKALINGARSNQFPKLELHKDAGEARAAIVVKNVNRFALQNVTVNWPKSGDKVPVEWQHKERIENGTTRIHRYDYRNPVMADLSFMWGKNITKAWLQNPFAESSNSKDEVYVLENVEKI